VRTLPVKVDPAFFAALQEFQWWRTHVCYHLGEMVAIRVLAGQIAPVEHVFVLEQIPNLLQVSSLLPHGDHV